MKNDIDISIIIPGHTRYLRLICEIGRAVAQEIYCPEKIRNELSSQLEIVLTEGVANAIKHANGSDTEKEIQINISVSDSILAVQICDSGSGFNIDTVQPPCFTVNGLEEKGRGIFILRSLMDTVKYTVNNGENVLEMRKNLAR